MKKLFIAVVILFTSYTAFCQLEPSPMEKQGEELLDQGKTNESIEIFKKVLAEKPSSLYSINALCLIYNSKYRFQEAYDMADRGMKVYTGDNTFFVATKAKAALSLKKPQEVVDMIDNYFLKHKPDFELRYIKGLAFDKLGDLQQAITAFSQSISENPEYAGGAYFNRGKDFADLERYPQALKDYDKYISLVNDDADAYNYRGIVYYKTNKPDEAIADYTKCIQLNPKQKYALSNRGQIYIEQKQTDKAFADFNAAIAIDPNYSDPYFQSASLCRNIKDYNRGLIFINKAIALQPNYAYLYGLKSFIYFGLDNDNEALAAAEKTLQLDPKKSDGFLAKATALSNQSKFSEALNTLNLGISYLPDNYLLYGLRASVHRFKGETQLADADDLKAKQLAAK